MKRFILVAVTWSFLAPLHAQTIAPEKVEATIKAMFANADPVWRKRVDQDETQAVCSQYRNAPPADIATKIRAREKVTIKYPADNNVMGDWKKGEAIAQKGTGGQFSDPPNAPNGANCYACHQMDKAEVSYGTLGPSLAGYGKIRNFAAKENIVAYEKIYNSQAVFACSMMPRFGYHEFLTMDQIKDVTAYLMSPDSPVNK